MSHTLDHVNLWIPDRPDRDALGDLPEGVVLNLLADRDAPGGEGAAPGGEGDAPGGEGDAPGGEGDAPGGEGDAPEGILDAEFLVPGSENPSVLGLLDRMSRLRVVQTLSAGVDWVLPALPPGVTLCDASGARDGAVAEWVLAAILASVKHLGEARDSQRAHKWQWQEPGELAGKTAMILGYGSIGMAVEARLAPFELEVVRVARHARPGVHSVDELASMLGLADIVIVLLPLTPATEGLLDRELLGRLRPGALLVNAARGPILDSDALVELLQAGRVRAALDVTDPEPLPADHPLWDAPDTLITPHFAGDTRGAERRAFALVGEQVRRYMRGELLVNVVEGGY